MVLDFGWIKHFIRESFDHKVLVYEKDDVLMDATAFFERKVMPCETTAENLAVYIKVMLWEKCFPGQSPEDVQISVVVHESETSFARC